MYRIGIGYVAIIAVLHTSIIISSILSVFPELGGTLQGLHTTHMGIGDTGPVFGWYQIDS